jgi:hypothetical protein
MCAEGKARHSGFGLALSVLSAFSVLSALSGLSALCSPPLSAPGLLLDHGVVAQQ